MKSQAPSLARRQLRGPSANLIFACYSLDSNSGGYGLFDKFLAASVTNIRQRGERFIACSSACELRSANDLCWQLHHRQRNNEAIT